MLRSNPHILTLTIRNCDASARTTSFTYKYIRLLDIRTDFPCCTQSTDLTRTPIRSQHVMLARFNYRDSCPNHH